MVVVWAVVDVFVDQLSVPPVVAQTVGAHTTQMAQTVGPHTNDTAQIAQTVSSNTSGTAQMAQTFGFRFK